MRSFLPSLLLAALLTGCAAQAQQAPKSTKKAAAAKPARKSKKVAPTAAAQETAPAIIFSKTPCLGRCPHYNATIFPDGRVQYEGFQHAPVEGKREFRISVATVNTILAQARALNFAKLPKTYSDGTTNDMPTTSLSIRQPGASPNAVTVELDAPAELTSLMRYVEKQITDGVGATVDR